jgi:hypothetical protein
MNHHPHAGPERSRGESIDETIDRVAAHLTMVPADPTLARRIAEQLDRQASFNWPRLAMASAAVAVVVTAAVLFHNQRAVPREDVARVVTPAPERAASTDDAPAHSGPLTVASAATPNRAAAPRASMAIEEPLPEMPQIDSLASPVTIDVAMLPTDTLTIDPVDVAPLGMADLTVRDIDERSSSKE